MHSHGLRGTVQRPVAKREDSEYEPGIWCCDEVNLQLEAGLSEWRLEETLMRLDYRALAKILYDVFYYR
jgi:hypothetical protein